MANKIIDVLFQIQALLDADIVKHLQQTSMAVCIVGCVGLFAMSLYMIIEDYDLPPGCGIFAAIGFALWCSFAVGYGLYAYMSLGMTNDIRNILITSHVLLGVNAIFMGIFYDRAEYDWVIGFIASVITLFGSYILAVIVFVFFLDWTLSLTILCILIVFAGLIILDVFGRTDYWEKSFRVSVGIISLLVGIGSLVTGYLGLSPSFTFNISLGVDISLTVGGVLVIIMGSLLLGEASTEFDYKPGYTAGATIGYTTLFSGLAPWIITMVNQIRQTQINSFVLTLTIPLSFILLAVIIIIGIAGYNAWELSGFFVFGFFLLFSSIACLICSILGFHGVISMGGYLTPKIMLTFFGSIISIIGSIFIGQGLFGDVSNRSISDPAISITWMSILCTFISVGISVWIPYILKLVGQPIDSIFYITIGVPTGILTSFGIIVPLAATRRNRIDRRNDRRASRREADLIRQKQQQESQYWSNASSLVKGAIERSKARRYETTLANLKRGSGVEKQDIAKVIQDKFTLTYNITLDGENVTFNEEKEKFMEKARKALEKTIDKASKEVFTISLEEIKAQTKIDVEILETFITTKLIEKYSIQFEDGIITFKGKEGIMAIIEQVENLLDRFYDIDAETPDAYELLTAAKIELEAAIDNAHHLGADAEMEDCKRLLRTVNKHIKEFDIEEEVIEEIVEEVPEEIPIDSTVQDAIEHVEALLNEYYDKNVETKETYELLTKAEIELKSAIKHATDIGFGNETNKLEFLLKTVRKLLDEFELEEEEKEEEIPEEPIEAEENEDEPLEIEEEEILGEIEEKLEEIEAESESKDEFQDFGIVTFEEKEIPSDDDKQIEGTSEYEEYGVIPEESSIDLDSPDIDTSVEPELDDENSLDVVEVIEQYDEKIKQVESLLEEYKNAKSRNESTASFLPEAQAILNDAIILATRINSPEKLNICMELSLEIESCIDEYKKSKED
ncbi:MAG: sulfite exporter TauE/SafE family protein [Asgard group archaeon]|nr:sulfite exporter TauE/SafE family protein [Asgard group archaeon]